jgi:hypothetical protein
MRSPLRPLDRSTRMGDTDYPGALRPVAEGWRVSVSPDGRRYRLQSLLSGPDGPVWASPPALVGLTLAALVARGAGLVEGLAQACEGLPDDPALAAPELTLQRQAMIAGVVSDRVTTDALNNERRRSFLRQQNEKRAALSRGRSRS